MTLADVVLLKVPVSWSEAVGVVLEFLDHVLPNAALPDPASVALSPIGEMRAVSKAKWSGVPVKRAADLLKQLIGDSNAPAALRDLIGEDTGERPPHESLPEFARALSYFERPNRRADVAAVYARARTLFEKAASDKELDRLRARAIHDQAAKPTKGRFAWQWPSSGRILNGVVVVALCVIIAASSFALVQVAVTPIPQRADAPPPPEVEAPLIAKTPAAIAAAVSNPGAIVEAASVQVKKLIDRGLAAARVSLASSKTRPDGVPQTPAPESSRSGRRPARSTASVVATPASTQADGRTGRRQWTVSVQEVTSPIGLAEFVAVAADEAPQNLMPIYSRGDSDVEPAVLVRPQMPSEHEAFAALDEPSVFDLLIDESGHVEQVRLVSPENRFADRILVSAAKAWQFQPASRDGQPVRYRLRLRINH
jgi:hypothetical protein